MSRLSKSEYYQNDILPIGFFGDGHTEESQFEYISVKEK